MLNTVGCPQPSSIPGMTNHTMPSTTNHSISPNERTALAITRQQRKISGTWVVPSQESSHPFASSRRIPDVAPPAHPMERDQALAAQEPPVL
ncbi:MAG: hypothetical protein AB7F94_16625 [Nitrospira sp.]